MRNILKEENATIWLLKNLEIRHEKKIKSKIIFYSFIVYFQRKQREDTIAVRASLLEKENASLRSQVCN